MTFTVGARPIAVAAIAFDIATRSRSATLDRVAANARPLAANDGDLGARGAYVIAALDRLIANAKSIDPPVDDFTHRARCADWFVASSDVREKPTHPAFSCNRSPASNGLPGEGDATRSTRLRRATFFLRTTTTRRGEETMSTTTANPNKPTAKDLDAKAIQGTDKHLSSGTSLTLVGSAFTPASLKAVFQADIDAVNAADAARAHWRQEVAVQRTTRTNTRAVRKALKSYLLGTFGPAAVGVLGDFGFTPPKAPGKKTVAAKSQGLVKAAATRAARHTMGTRQKKAVKGGVIGITVTPITAARPAAAPSTPTTHVATSLGTVVTPPAGP
jgi:hypothetical protein